MIKLYGYFRSSAAYRVRIALNLKGVEYDQYSVHLRNKEQSRADFLALNPQGLVPVLEDQGVVVTQSIAILEYLNEQHPEPSFLPNSAADCAYVRSIALAIACDIHPLNNLRILKYLEYNLKLDDDQKNQWYRHWIAVEFQALEQKLAADKRRGEFCFGDEPGMADICLVPQISNARRFNCNLKDYPTLVAIDHNCNQLEAFQEAAPENQPDAE